MADSITPNYTLPPDAPRVMLMDGCVGGAEGGWDAALSGSRGLSLDWPRQPSSVTGAWEPLSSWALGIGRGGIKPEWLRDATHTEREEEQLGEAENLLSTHRCGNNTACRAEELQQTMQAVKPLCSLDSNSPTALASEGLPCCLHGLDFFSLMNFLTVTLCMDWDIPSLSWKKSPSLEDNLWALELTLFCPASNFLWVFSPILWQVLFLDNFWCGILSEPFSNLDCATPAGSSLRALITCTQSSNRSTRQNFSLQKLCCLLQQTMYIPVFTDFISTDSTAVSKGGWSVAPTGHFHCLFCGGARAACQPPAAWLLAVMLGCIAHPAALELRGKNEQQLGTEWGCTQDWKPPLGEMLATCYFASKDNCLVSKRDTETPVILLHFSP